MSAPALERKARRATLGLIAVVTIVLLAAGAVSVWMWRKDAPARALQEKGEAHYRRGELEAALEAWQSATERHPRFLPPYFRMAEALQELGETDAAVQVLLRAGDASPKAPHLKCRLAEAYSLAEAPEQASALSAEAIAQEPDCARAHAAFAAARRDEPEIAVAHLRRALQLAPRDQRIMLQLARTLAHGRQMPEARQVLDKLRAVRPLDAETHYLWGVVLSERPGDRPAIAEAEKHLRGAIRLEPERFDAYAQLGILFSRQREWTKARPLLVEARRLNPASEAVLYQLGTVSRQLRQPGAAAFWDELRALQARTKRWRELQRKLAENPDNLPLLLEGAELSLALGARQAAGRLATAVLEKEPGNEKARRVLDALQQPAAPESLR
jgi:tetratricopeptide (TPR) repeat protein